MRVHDPLREPGRARRVVELRRIVGRRVGGRVLGGVLLEQVGREHDDGYPARGEARCVRLVRHEYGWLGVAEPVRDAVVAVKDRHREEQRADLPRPEEDRRRLRRRRQHDGDAILAPDAVRLEGVRGAGRESLELAPGQFPPSAVESLVDHRELLAWVLVAAVRGDVVALGYAPLVRCADLVVTGHGRLRVLRESSAVATFREVAGAEGLEPPTYGFGDRRSTN